MLRLLFAAPFILLLVIFALSNRQPVQFGIWPTDVSIEVPAALAILVPAAIAFLLGAVLMWFAAISQRRRAGRAERRAALLAADLAKLRDAPPGSVMGGKAIGPGTALPRA
jgi:lipopolysaccharide assembly protein A